MSTTTTVTFTATSSNQTLTASDAFNKLNEYVGMGVTDFSLVLDGYGAIILSVVYAIARSSP